METKVEKQNGIAKQEAKPNLLAEINSDLKLAKTADQFNEILNREPNSKWVKKHPFAAGVNYLPIDKVEHMLTVIFQEWRVEVLDYKTIFNSVTVQVRLHYKNPTTGQWGYHDGLGAMDVQVEKGESPADLSKIKAYAIMKCLPAAKSYAIKDAAEHLGKLFGRDLNRRDTIAFSGIYSTEEKAEAYQNQLKKLQGNGSNE